MRAASRSGWGASLRRPVRVPVALVAAYMGVVVLLGGGILLNHQNVRDLEVAVQQRDQLLDTLRVRLAESRSVNPAAVPVMADDAAEPNVVFLPAGVGPTGLAPASSLPGSTVYGTTVPASYRVSESPRIVH